MTKLQTPPASSFFTAALKGGALATVLNLGLYFAALAAGVTFTGQLEPGGAMDMAIPAPMFAIGTMVPAFFAALFAWLLARKSAKAGVIFLALSVVVTLLSMGGPLGLAGASMGTKLVLSVMHLVAALPITVALLRGPLRSQA